MKLGEEIRKQRKEIGMSIAELAEKLETQKSFISEVECCKKYIPKAKENLICKILNFDYDIYRIHRTLEKIKLELILDEIKEFSITKEDDLYGVYDRLEGLKTFKTIREAAKFIWIRKSKRNMELRLS